MTSAPSAFGQASLHEVKSPSELPIWRTLIIGLDRSVNAVRYALDEARIAVGDLANEVLGRPAFTFNDERRELDLVVLSVAARATSIGREALAMPLDHGSSMTWGQIP